MNQLGIGLCGIGTVGSGVFNLLADNASLLERRIGFAPRIVHVAYLANPYKCDLSAVRQSSDVFELVRNPEVGIVVELIGGKTLARELVAECIRRGKHVVTANKALLAEHGDEIFRMAQEAGVQVRYEAAIAGAIPIVKALREGLAGNRILSIAGIINGTTNFILSEMQIRQGGFGEVLEEAQRLGYAEANPTFDVEGIDAAHKLTLLASLAFGVPVNFSGAYTEGISGITQQDMRFAAELGYTIKHLGITRMCPTGLELRVHPALVPLTDMLASVSGPMNAVWVRSDAAGTTMYYGAGAGSRPTASAIVADLIDVYRNLDHPFTQQVPLLGFQRDAIDAVPILPIGETVCASYLRMEVEDKPGVMASISTILSQRQISIESLIQKRDSTPRQGSHVRYLPIVLVTNQVRESLLNEAIEAIQALPQLVGKVTRIRVASLNDEDE